MTEGDRESTSSERTLAEEPTGTKDASNEKISPVTEKSSPASVQPAESHLVQFGPNDPLNAQNWSFRFKLFQTIIMAQSCIVVTFASSVFAASTQAVADEFNVSVEVSTLGTSLFLMGYVTGPPIFGPLSEFMGRRWPLLVSYFAFSLFNLPAATGKDIQTILICRFFAGFFAVGPVSIVAGSFVDMWSNEARGNALTLFCLCVIGGPAVGPVVGGFITTSHLGWRWTSYITFIWSISSCVVLAIGLKESFAPRILQDKARELRLTTGNWAYHAQLDERRVDFKEIAHVYLLRPFAMFFQEPILFIMTIYIAFIYGLIFGLFEAVPYVFIQQRGWKDGPAGLPFLAVLVGALGAGAICFAFSRRYNRILRERKAISVPEERCLPMCIGAIIYPAGLFLFGWTNPDYVSSFWPSIIGLGLVGMAFVLIFLSGFNLIIDCYLMLANSAIAANTIVRSAVAAAFPLFSAQMFANLGTQWASSLLGFIAIALAPFPFLFYFWMPTLLRKSKYAPKIGDRAKPQPKKGEQV